MPVIDKSIILKSTLPNFDRDQVKTISDLKNARPAQYDLGHIVYCKEDKEHYKFMGSGVENDPETGYFRPLIPDTVNDTSKLQEQVDSNTDKINQLYDKEFPISVNLDAYTEAGASLPKIQLKGTNVSGKLKFSIKRSGDDVSQEQISKLVLYINNSPIELVSTSREYNIEANTDTTYKISFEMVDGTKKESFISITFCNYSYYGVVPETGDIDILNLNPVLVGKKGYSITISQDNERSCYAYPSSFGKLTSIKDNKNYELINSYTLTNASANGETYNVYTLTNASTVENYKLIFS